MSGIRVLSLTDFCELLRWGIIMGVSQSGKPHKGAQHNASMLPAYSGMLQDDKLL